MSEPLVRDGFVFNLHEDLRPCYRLNPFTTGQTAAFRPAHSPEASRVDAVLAERFNGRPFAYTANGRQAIREALRLLQLAPDDCVTILTSTGNHYISGCVTSEISAVCQWSRKIEPTTKVLFVNHEFGVPYPNLSALKHYGLPIIEDCCYAFHSATPENHVGQVGDFVLYSFAKYFPIQFGGLLIAPMGQALPADLLDTDTAAYLRRALNQLYPEIDDIATRRHANQVELARRLAPLGLIPRFDFSAGGVPGVFMFTAPANWLLPALKEFIWDCGIHCSVFYGEQAFFIPVHQALSVTALDYFSVCLAQFAQQCAPAL